MYFPRHAGGFEESKPAESQPVAAQFKATILLAEDDAEVRIATRRLLERFGYVVMEASDAETALAMLRAGDAQIDLVLTDAVMPGMSGLALAERLAAERPALPRVLMSGYSEEAINRGSPLTANVVFMEKPFSVQALSRTVADTLASARPQAR